MITEVEFDVFAQRVVVTSVSLVRRKHDQSDADRDRELIAMRRDLLALLAATGRRLRSCVTRREFATCIIQLRYEDPHYCQDW